MARVEDDLWWYRGLRDVLVRTLRAPRVALPERPRVLDAGCGTGRNLAALHEFFQPSYLGGFDLSPEALRFAQEKAPEADLSLGDICDPPLGEADLDLVISMDVLYIPGARRALPGLRQLVSMMRRGGLLVLNLPAYDWLFSEHDLAIDTIERYTIREVEALFGELGLRIRFITYRLCFLFPLVLAYRLPDILGRTPEKSEAKSDLHHIPAALTNNLLFAALRAENSLIERGIRLPFGSSVYAIGSKP